MPVLEKESLAILREAEKPDLQIKKKRRIYFIVKKCFDFFAAFLASIILIIPFVVISLVIMVKDRGSPFYVQERVGKNGTPIHIAKFRSMKMGADHLEDMLSPELLEEYRREYKLEDDPRLIGWQKHGDGKKCFGGIIRKTSLDELPQIIWNILIKGDMSIVGPRPILEDELYNNYTPEQQKALLSVKPGLTGYWQAYARNNANYNTGERQQMELYYVAHASVWLDIKIIFATVGAVLKGRGAK